MHGFISKGWFMGKTATRTRAGFKLNLTGVERVILYVTDWDRAVKFYTETLGIPLKYKEDGWAALATRGIELNLHSGRKSRAQKDEASIGFRVDDFDATYAALKQRGVKVGEIYSPCEELRCANFTDPDGNRLSIEGR